MRGRPRRDARRGARPLDQGELHQLISSMGCIYCHHVKESVGIIVDVDVGCILSVIINHKQ